MILYGFPVASQTRIFLVIASVASPIASGRDVCGPRYRSLALSFSSSHFHPFARTDSAVIGKNSCARVSLYPNGDKLIGKYSPHSPVVRMCSMIRGMSSSYSSFVYGLFKIQYFFPFTPKQPNKCCDAEWQ